METKTETLPEKLAIIFYENDEYIGPGFKAYVYDLTTKVAYHPDKDEPERVGVYEPSKDQDVQGLVTYYETPEEAAMQISFGWPDIPKYFVVGDDGRRSECAAFFNWDFHRVGIPVDAFSKLCGIMFRRM